MKKTISGMLQEKFLKNQISLSWWIYNLSSKEPNILFFNVQGLLLTGAVSIYYKKWKDLFDIIFTNKNHNTIKYLKWIYIEDLIDTIDFVVEKNCSDKEYKEKIDNFNKRKGLFIPYSNNINIINYE